MYYIQPTPNPSGAYPAPQSNRASGLLALPDELLGDFLACGGFVALTVEDGTVTALTPDTAAWEAWKSSLPEPAAPEPTDLELTQQAITDLELSDIEQGQAITDLELQLWEVTSNV